MLYPNMPLGFSDHTAGHSAVLGAIALGARVIEKHFTDDNTRVGPDHNFALNPQNWQAMVDASKELWAALGDGVKRVEDNELDTVIIQRRAIRMAGDRPAGHILVEEDLVFLRPCPSNAFTPGDLHACLGKKLKIDLKLGDHLYHAILDNA